ncbi:MAG: efflux RND transporter periplasmic adaptor subunit [Candidatus Brocadiales bacterium]
MTSLKKISAIIIVILIGTVLALAILRVEKTTSNDFHEPTDSDHIGVHYVKGPLGGRLLSKAGFQLEITIFEPGIPPQFRVYPFDMGEPISPEEVTLTIELHRLGGRVDVINFNKEGKYLRGDKVVEEPHSFDVKVSAEWNGHPYHWEYSQIEGRVELSPEAVQNAGIVVETAVPAKIKTVLELPGQVVLNADKVVHIVPRVSGVVTEVYKNLGDNVKYGEIIAVIESRELAELRSNYLASIKRAELARVTFNRKERLWKQKISSEKEYLASNQAMAEAEINLDVATHKLMALGLSQADLDVSEKTHENLTRYEIRALFNGEVIEKHITVGEAVKEDANIFFLADLSTVWVEVTVYTKDLRVVKIGQNVTVRSNVLDMETDGNLSYLGPLVSEQTRTARGRVVVENPEGYWRPGLFVTVEVVKEEVSVPLAVSVDALQTFRDWSVVFVQYGNLFEVRPLELGRSDGRWVEVLHGLEPGERYVTHNSFILKAELGKAGATHDH